MTFDKILGQTAAVRTLIAALDSGRLHHAYRFEGPDGVGKERCAFAFAKALIYPGAHKPGFVETALTRRVDSLSEVEPHVPLHPDLVLVARGLYPQSLIGAAEATGISVEQIRRVVLPRVGFPPHEGAALVFIIRDAEELTVSAANALLKTLEEPRKQVHFILLSSSPRRLLDTVRSRTLAVRFGPLPESTIANILEQHGKPPTLAALAQGSASLALLLADENQMRAREDFVTGACAALVAPNLGKGLDFASTYAKERDALSSQLFALAQHFALEGRRLVQQDPHSALMAARRFQKVTAAQWALERNAQPTLTVEALMKQLREV